MSTLMNKCGTSGVLVQLTDNCHSLTLYDDSN